MTINLFEHMKQNGFDVPKELLDEKVKKKKDSKNSAKKTSTTKATKKEEKYPIPVNIHYSGTDYQILAEEYPDKKELTKKELFTHFKDVFRLRILKEKRTLLEYDKDNNEIICVIKNPSKGFSFTQGLHRYSAINGDFFIKKGEFGYIIGPKEENLGETISIPNNIKPGAYLSQKISSEILFKILHGFMNSYPNEVLAQVFFDTSTCEFILHWPEQNTTETRIERDKGYFYLDSKNKVLFAEVHSHGQYDAKFSNTDNENELDFLIYGIIGRIDSIKPDYKFRLGFNGLFKEIDIMDVFEI